MAQDKPKTQERISDNLKPETKEGHRYFGMEDYVTFNQSSQTGVDVRQTKEEARQAKEDERQAAVDAALQAVDEEIKKEITNLKSANTRLTNQLKDATSRIAALESLNHIEDPV